MTGTVCIKLDHLRSVRHGVVYPLIVDFGPKNWNFDQKVFFFFFFLKKISKKEKKKKSIKKTNKQTNKRENIP